jgi:hypothetical protein
MSTQNAEKVDLVRQEDKEKDILNRFTDLCIRKKDRGKNIRLYMEVRSVGAHNPEFNKTDVLIEDEKTMEDMLKLYMEKCNAV